MIKSFGSRNRANRSKKLHPSPSFVIRTANHSVGEHKGEAQDEELRDQVTKLEKLGDDNWHPTGRYWWSPFLIILGIFHNAFRNTHKYLQPERQESIVDMMESYLGMLTLFYSLVGVMAVEISLTPVTIDEELLDSNANARLILIGIARLGWFALGPICLTCVATSIHVLWSGQVVTVHHRRRFLLKNQVYFSMPYAFAPPVFVLLHISIIAQNVASVLRAQSPWLRYAEIIGVTMGILPVLPLVYASGAIMEDAFRPWGPADKENEEAAKYKEEMRLEGMNSVNSSAKSDVSYKSDVSEDAYCGELHAHLKALGLTYCEELILLEGLNWATMRDVVKKMNSPLMLDRMLQSAGVKTAGHRAQIILRLHKDIGKEETKLDTLQIRSINNLGQLTLQEV